MAQARSTEPHRSVTRWIDNHGVTNGQVYAKFRLSIDNGFRNEFSYVHYRRWGVTEIWEGGRFASDPPKRADANQGIEVWFNWELVGVYKSYDDARGVIRRLLKDVPASLHDLEQYLSI